jgi:hypothetical protein
MKSPRTAARKFIDGFKAAAKPTTPPFDDPNIGATGTSDDLLDYASLDQVERQKNYDLGINPQSEAEPVRTINNMLDFLGNVGEEVLDVLAHGDDKLAAKPDKPFVMNVYLSPGHAWKTVRYTVAERVIQLARKSQDRITLTIVNLGPEVVYVTEDSGPNGYGAVANSRGIPVSKLDGTGPYNPVSINTQGEVWVRSTTGSVVAPSIIEVTETFGAPEKSAG